MKRFADSTFALKALVGLTRVTGRYSVALSGVFADRLWFTPWTVPLSERAIAKQRMWLEHCEPFEQRTADGHVAGFTRGEGPSVLLVHGWGERAASLGGFIAPLTAAGYRVVGVDLPAHGDSRGRTSNIIDAGRAIWAVAQSLGPVHAVVAHSFGGSAVLYALRLGLPLERVVLLAPNVDLTHALERFSYLFGLPPKAVEGLRRSINRRFGESVWHDFRGDVLAEGLDVPALVFHDREDPQVPYGDSQRLVRAWPKARLIEVQGAGHGGITRTPAIIEEVVQFVAEGDGSTRRGTAAPHDAAVR